MKCKKMCQDSCDGHPWIDTDGYVKCWTCKGFLNPGSLKKARNSFKKPVYTKVEVSYKKTYNPFYFQGQGFWTMPWECAEEINDEM